MNYKKTLLILVTAFLGLISSGAMAGSPPAVEINVGGTNYDFTYVVGSYNSLSSTYFNTTYMPWYGDDDKALTFATALYNSPVGLGYDNYGSPPYFASRLYNLFGPVYVTYGAFLQQLPNPPIVDGGPPIVALLADPSVSAQYAVASIVVGSGAAPEMNASLIPQVGLLLACLFFLMGRKKENAEPMMTV